MLNEQTIEKLYAMKLNGMAEAFKEQLQVPDMNELSFDERFSLLVDRQWTWREDRRMKRLLSNAKLKIKYVGQGCCIIEDDEQPGLSEAGCRQLYSFLEFEAKVLQKIEY